MRLKSMAIFCRLAVIAACAALVCGVVLMLASFPMGLALIVGVTGWHLVRGQRRLSGWNFGTARLASLATLYRHHLLDAEDGVLLGRAGPTLPTSIPKAAMILLTAPLSRSDTAVRMFLAACFGTRWSAPSLIRLRKFVHLVTFAAAGRGKSVGVLVPNLLSYRKSCVVMDPKGELFQLTAEHRRKQFRHRIIRLDPFGISGPGVDRFNPLDLINPESPFLLDQCRDLANALVVRTGKEHEPHFCDMAELVLAATICFVVVCETSPEAHNLQTVRDIVSSRDRFAKAIDAMRKGGGVLERFGNLLNWPVDRELGSIGSTVQRFTAFLDSPAIAENTMSSSFDPRVLRSGRATLYLCLPPERLVSLAPLMRMWVASLLRSIAMQGADERNEILFLLDEAGHIGHIQALEDAVTLMRGYGVRLWFFFQSVGQLTKCFGDRAGIILDNMDTQQFFGVNALESAEMISKRIGDATVTSVSTQTGSSISCSEGVTGSGGPLQRSDSTSTTVSEMARQLFKPEEITRMDEDLAVIFHRNLPPILARLLRYYDDPEFRRGGTGRPRGLGLAAILAIAGLLIGCCVVGHALSVLPEAARQSGRTAQYRAPDRVGARPDNPWRVQGPRGGYGSLPSASGGMGGPAGAPGYFP